MSIMECQASLEIVRVTALRFGSKGMPFILPTFCYRGRSTPLKVEIYSSSGCWLGLTETLPCSEALILNTAGPLHVGLPATPETLTWYDLGGGSASNIGQGPLSLKWQLAQALSPVERTQAAEVEVHGPNDTAVEEHAAHAHKRGAHALRCIKTFVGQCWGLGHASA